jgi:hypothetical protein
VNDRSRRRPWIRYSETVTPRILLHDRNSVTAHIDNVARRPLVLLLLWLISIVLRLGLGLLWSRLLLCGRKTWR